MTREKIIEIAFMTIVDALNWGTEKESGADFAMFVEGVESMTRKLVENLSDESHNCSCGSCKCE